MLDKIKKRMASINFTFLLLIAAFAVYRGIDPCESLFTALTGVGIDELSIGVTEYVDEGPPLQSKLVVELDGQVVKILENGSVLIEEKE